MLLRVAGLHVVVVTGMSGAGRSTTLHVLEDLGFFCVDNLPPSLAPQLIETLANETEIGRVGLGVDVRTRSFLAHADEVFENLGASGHELEVLFLDCADEVLVHRFSETRRPHMLAPGGDILSAIQTERERLGPLRQRARVVIDTTDLSVHELRRRVVAHVARAGTTMVTRLVSFGFKHGLPVDADLVFDLRYLPNPHFVPELRPKAGTDPDVARYVLEAPETQELLADLVPLLEHTIPRYGREGKAYLTIAIGCTGGRHRSVAMVEELASRLQRDDRELVVVHRDVDRTRPR